MFYNFIYHFCGMLLGQAVMVPTFTANGLAEYAICGGDIDLRALAQKQVGQSYFASRSSKQICL